MRRVSAALLASLALAAAISGPAEARRTPNRAEAIRHQIDELQRDVNRNDNRDNISEREAAGLRADVASLQAQFRAFNANGLDNGEMRTLENRIHTIRERLHGERHDADHHRM